MSRLETPGEMAERLFGHPDKQVVAEEAIRARDEQIRAWLLDEVRDALASGSYADSAMRDGAEALRIIAERLR